MPIYRSSSNRLSEYNYSQAGIYFVTICIDRSVFGIDYKMFGKVVENNVILNDLGLFVEQQIKETGVVRPYVEIISYIVMHDHIHIILQIHEHNIMNKPSTNIMDTPAAMSLQHDKTHGKSNKIHQFDRRDGPVARPGNEAGPGIKLQSHSLGSIINHIKGSVTRYAKQHNIQFKRQSNYYEHIVRNSNDLEKILHYIEMNPIRRTERQSNILP